MVTLPRSNLAGLVSMTCISDPVIADPPGTTTGHPHDAHFLLPYESTNALRGLPRLCCPSYPVLTHKMTGKWLSSIPAATTEKWWVQGHCPQTTACTSAFNVSIFVAGAPLHSCPCALVVWSLCQAKCKPHPTQEQVGGGGIWGDALAGQRPGAGESSVCLCLSVGSLNRFFPSSKMAELQTSPPSLRLYLCSSVDLPLGSIWVASGVALGFEHRMYCPSGCYILPF